MPSGRRWAAAAVLGLAATVGVARAVQVAPTLVVLSPRVPGTEVLLVNAGRDTAALAIGVRDGRWTADTTGRAMVVPASEATVSSWIRVTPDRVVLPPGGRATVTVRADPPAGLAAGDYGTRLEVTSERLAPAARADADSTRVEAAWRVVVTQTLPVRYRTGRVAVALAVAEPAAAVAGDSIVVTFDAALTGNAAWIGTATVVAEGAGGREVARAAVPLMLEQSERRRLVVAVPPPLPPVTAVRLALETRRDGLPRDALVPARPVRLRVPVGRP